MGAKDCNSGAEETITYAPDHGAAASDTDAAGKEGYEHFVDSSQHPEAFERTSHEDLSAMERQYASTPSSLPRRIHILGTGSIGKFVAHALRGLPKPPPVTLLLHRYRLLEAWDQGTREISIQDGEGLVDGEPVVVRRSGFEVELMPEVRREHGVELEEGQPSVYDFGEQVRPHEAAKHLDQQQKEAAARRASAADVDTDEEQPPPNITTDAQPQPTNRSPHPGEYALSNEPIHNLIVTTKATRTISALSRIRHRLSRDSTICFLQNGMGILSAVDSALFPDENERPNYIQGIITHGVNTPPSTAAQDPFFAVHAGRGTVALGLMPRSAVNTKPTTLPHRRASDGEQKRQTELWAPSSRYLLRTLTRSPLLCAVGFTPFELFQQQLEKLAVNSILNPLTVLLDNRNGSLLYNFALTRTMRLMLAETSLVIRSLPELRGIPNVTTRFAASRLETLVVSVAHKTRHNLSSMLSDARAGKKTEIDFINGYIVRRGEEVGVKCVVNYAIMQTVVGKTTMVGREIRAEVPEEGRGARVDE